MIDYFRNTSSFVTQTSEEQYFESQCISKRTTQCNTALRAASTRISNNNIYLLIAMTILSAIYHCVA